MYFLKMLAQNTFLSLVDSYTRRTKIKLFVKILNQ